MNQLVPEVLLALGGAFLLGNLAAYVRLRPAWREAKRAARSRTAGGAKAARGAGSQGGTKAPGGPKTRGAKAPPLPSRTRVLVNVIVGLVVTVASLAALITRG